MDFFKLKKFGKARKGSRREGEALECDEDANGGNVASEGDIFEENPEAAAGAGVANGGGAGVANGGEEVGEEEEDEDDDFITNEVKRRLKEMRKNTFMVLIPEEENAEVEEDEDGEEEEEGSSSREWMESDVGEGFPLCGFDSLYEKYSQRMVAFDKTITQVFKDSDLLFEQFHDFHFLVLSILKIYMVTEHLTSFDGQPYVDSYASRRLSFGSFNISKKSPRSASKLASTLRSLSFKRRDELQEDCENLQQQQSEDDPYQILETAYVAQVSLSWEAIHCTYMHLSLILAAQPENPTTYSCAAQAFQQFQVLLQRFVENEPFEQGSRFEIYARSRSSLSKLLQVPTFQGPLPTSFADSSNLHTGSSLFHADFVRVLEPPNGPCESHKAIDGTPTGIALSYMNVVLRCNRKMYFENTGSEFTMVCGYIGYMIADGKDNAEDQTEPILAPDLMKLLEECILTFRVFLKKDKKKSSVLMGVHGHTGSSIQQVQSSLDKKEMKVKELFKKKKGWKSKTWPTTMEEVQLLFALTDIKVVSRVLRMAKLSKEQLLWCEEKMSKLDLSDNKLRRDGCPILFPC
ncbi:unnamed protein product [Triticum turgidum subsp. durum]|uniref:Uncharacterized protein n=1 Tax=Triticum turgidum subsp. durum TaxID=4567 RepID=A0A9R1BYN9_TRITD|nr:unnamed protein product [Triticum turgidum subsp. durum]